MSIEQVRSMLLKSGEVVPIVYVGNIITRTRRGDFLVPSSTLFLGVFTKLPKHKHDQHQPSLPSKKPTFLTPHLLYIFPLTCPNPSVSSPIPSPKKNNIYLISPSPPKTPPSTIHHKYHPSHLPPPVLYKGHLHPRSPPTNTMLYKA